MIRGLICCLVLLTSCGSQEYRLGNQYDDPKVISRRDDERDRVLNRQTKEKTNNAKHYIKEYKSHDGKINLFRRDGFDWGY
jgi:major membrane immunogen (membrane-anchored lipoprotein)